SATSLSFLLKHRADLFPNTPIVFHTSSRAQAIEHAEIEGLTGVVVDKAYRNTLEVALRLHPSTERAFVITGTPERDKKLVTEVRQELEGLESRVAINYLNDLPLEELIARVKSAPARSIILYVRYSQDALGKTLDALDALSIVTQSAKAPVYTAAESLLGRGSIGGFARRLCGFGAGGGGSGAVVVCGVRAQRKP